MDLMISDLEKFSKQDLQRLANYYKTENNPIDIAKCNLLGICKAKMSKGTWHSSQISDVINVINSSINSNICLRRALIVTTYTDKPSVLWFETMELDIKKQQYDIYSTPSKGISGVIGDPSIVAESVANMDVPRFCFFVIWVKRDGYNPQLPVIDSHMTLALCEKSDNIYNVYKYNSGFFDPNNERELDLMFLKFLERVETISKYHYNLNPTETWCPRNLQGATELCTVYAFHIYYYLAKYRQMSIKTILDYQQQRPELVSPFYEDLVKKVKPLVKR